MCPRQILAAQHLDERRIGQSSASAMAHRYQT
jgi:hypothetical protein